ncbi:MAG: type II toxin-antitoxin system VapC family toxin, partial [Clostridia bacterium]|nr:type II toxin-antitoxin system VapC family toxin [Clostridia bacterium]
MDRYVIDTDVCVYIMEGLPSALSFWRRIEDKTVLFSVVTMAELLSHAALTEDDRNRIKAFLEEGGLLVDVDASIAEQAAELRRLLGRRRRKMRLPDALIAATALTEDAVLATHNVGDYRAAADVVGLRVEN